MNFTHFLKTNNRFYKGRTPIGNRRRYSSPRLGVQTSDNGCCLGCSGQTVYILNRLKVSLRFASFKGHKKLGSRPEWSPLGNPFKIFDEHRFLFNMEDPRGILSGETVVFLRSCPIYFKDTKRKEDKEEITLKKKQTN